MRSIRSETELLNRVRAALELGYTPTLEINGERYGFPLTYLMTEGSKCKWCTSGMCMLVGCFEHEYKCNGTPDDIAKCQKLWNPDEIKKNQET